MRYLIIIPALLRLASPAYGDRYEYRSDVNLEIPDFDSTGISDTIFVPVHVMIEDINFFIAIGTDENNAWAEQVWIDIFSPSGATVRLNDWGGDRVNWYFFWYDTDREVDGPGHLDDYVGLDSYGPWVMNSFDMFPDRVVTWYYWKVEVIGEPLTGLEEEDPLSIPADYVLDKNYPNPFNSSTSIKFGLPEESEVKIVIYDIVGRRVDVPVHGVMPAGYHVAVWDGRNSTGKPVASGIYMIRMTAPDRTFDRKMILLR